MLAVEPTLKKKGRGIVKRADLILSILTTTTTKNFFNDQISAKWFPS